jgi:hypothetical protein
MPTYPKRHPNGFLYPALSQPCTHEGACLCCAAEDINESLTEFFAQAVLVHGEALAVEMLQSLMATAMAVGIATGLPEEDFTNAAANDFYDKVVECMAAHGSMTDEEIELGVLDPDATIDSDSPSPALH